MIYIYPQNLKSAANLWLWSIKDFLITAIAVLISAFALVKLKMMLPMALSFCYGFLTIRTNEIRIVDFIRFAFCYFVTSQQSYFWRTK